MKQKSYHTSIKTCYALGLEEVLPESPREGKNIQENRRKIYTRCFRSVLHQKLLLMNF